MNTNKQFSTGKNENVVKKIEKIKQTLLYGDFNVIIENIQKNHNKTYSRSAVASCLNPTSDYFNPIIYAEALKLSISRQETQYDLKDLEQKLNN